MAKTTKAVRISLDIELNFPRDAGELIDLADVIEREFRELLERTAAHG
jgi:hypothetical protein